MRSIFSITLEKNGVYPTFLTKQETFSKIVRSKPTRVTNSGLFLQKVQQLKDLATVESVEETVAQPSTYIMEQYSEVSEPGSEKFFKVEFNHTSYRFMDCVQAAVHDSATRRRQRISFTNSIIKLQGILHPVSKCADTQLEMLGCQRSYFLSRLPVYHPPGNGKWVQDNVEYESELFGDPRGPHFSQDQVPEWKTVDLVLKSWGLRTKSSLGRNCDVQEVLQTGNVSVDFSFLCLCWSPKEHITVQNSPCGYEKSISQALVVIQCSDIAIAYSVCSDIATVHTVCSDVAIAYTLCSDVVIAYTVCSGVVIVYTVCSDVATAYPVFSDVVIVYTVCSDVAIIYTVCSDVAIIYTVCSDVVIVYTVCSDVAIDYTILSGIKYDKKWLLDLIQSQCNIPFTPVEFHYEKMHAQFFVDNPDIAFELKNISDKIWDESNNKITIFISPCDEPHLVTELKSEKMDRMKSHGTPSVILKLAMNQQGATSQQFLNMPRLPFVQGVIDSNLLAHPTDLSLNLRRCMAPSLDFYEEDMTQMLPLNQSNSKPYQMFGFPDTKAAAPTIDSLDESGNEMKSSGMVVKGQDLDPEEIREDQSSLSTTIPDKSSNIKYFFIYDNGDRQELVNAYHAEACFSLTVLFSSMDSSSSNLCGYFKHSRDMKVLKDPYMQQLLLKHKKYEIICFLHTLPKTQHDLPSFVVDICFQTETMLCFSVSGLFKEAEGSSQGCVHAFTRTFIATYGNSSEKCFPFSLCIINDKLLVRDVQGLPSASIPVATSSSGCLPALFQDQQKMEQTFSTQAGMNVESSQT
ncbi:hypothetical protein ACRRTK_002101 [Alexandromys fortis]